MTRNEDEMMGFRAALRWLLGTDAECSTTFSKEDAMRKVGMPLKQAEGDHYDRASAALDRLEQSQKALDNVLIPTRNLDEALTQMLGGRE